MEKMYIVNKVDKNTADIYVYGYIGHYDDVHASDFVKELKALEKTHKQINIHINSGGGSVFEGMAMYNAMKESTATIHTYNEGVAGSMGSILFLGGSKRFIGRHSVVMTHKPTVGTHGNATKLEQTAKLMRDLEANMTAIYAAVTGLSEADVKQKFLNDTDNWFNATEAVAIGLATEVYENAVAAAPAATTSEKDLYSYYANHIQKNKPHNMEQYFLNAEALASLKLTDKTPKEEVSAAVVAMAQKVTKLEADLAQANADKKTAEDKAAQVETDTVTALFDDAAGKSLCTKETAEELKKTFANNLAGAKAVIGTFKPYQSVADQLTGKDAGAAQELKELIAMSGDELFAKGKFERLKALDLNAYKAKYKECFGKEAPTE